MAYSTLSAPASAGFSPRLRGIATGLLQNWKLRREYRQTVHALRALSARDLAEYAAASEQAQTGFVEQLFHHCVKQPAAAYGEKTLEELHVTFAASQYNIRELFAEIATTAALQNSISELPKGSQ